MRSLQLLQDTTFTKDIKQDTRYINFLLLNDDMSHVIIISSGMNMDFVYVSFKMVERHEKELVETIYTSKKV